MSWPFAGGTPPAVPAAPAAGAAPVSGAAGGSGVADGPAPELQALARRLHRPAASLAAFAELPPERLEWLLRQVNMACRREEAEVRRELRQSVPWPFRWLVSQRLRQPL